MRKLDWQNLDLDEGVLKEPTPDRDRLVLWLPGSRDQQFQNWQRISNRAHAEVTIEQGICAIAATSIQARQPIRGFFGKLLRHFRTATSDRAWTLPNGESAEQCGERQTDRLLVWREDQTTSIDETQIKSLWPQAEGFQRIGKNLFLVSGVESPGEQNEAEQPLPPACPGAVAEQLLAAARRSGDRRREASALADLGAVHLHDGNGKHAVALLEQASTMIRELGDRSLEGDVLGNLGMANLVVGQRQRAQELFEQELTYARAAGNLFATKLALEHAGHAHASLGDPVGALACFEQALAIALEVGDQKHEADLLWYLGIQHADLGQRDQAIARAQAAVDLMGKIGRPQTGWFAEHLRRYRLDETGAGLGTAGEAAPLAAADALLSGSLVVSQYVSQPGPRPAHGQALRSPGLLRMALTATSAMAKFIGSGMKTVTVQTHEKRLQTCAACEHHTGVRCRLCGCFTSVKSRMPHEHCPLGKWPA